MIRNLLLGWGAGLGSLIIAGAGMSATLSGSATTDPLRLSFAAVVLGGYAALVGVIVTERTDRTWLRCLVWGGGVPIMIGWLTTIVVTVDAGIAAGAAGRRALARRPRAGRPDRPAPAGLPSVPLDPDPTRRPVISRPAGVEDHAGQD